MQKLFYTALILCNFIYFPIQAISDYARWNHYIHVSAHSAFDRQLLVAHPYDSLSAWDQTRLNQETYSQYVAWFLATEDVVFEKITYKSDGLQVVGIMGYQTQLCNLDTKVPVIIYNRGGTHDDNKILVDVLKDHMYQLIKAGYIVIASQYRGNDGGQGVDECGGADINDVINLYSVLQCLPNADLNNIFMLGFSRGAIDTFRVIQKNVMPIKAAAVISGLLDLFLLEESRPGISSYLRACIPHYDDDTYNQFVLRSATYWAQDIKVPTLLLHGDADTIVGVGETKKMASKLAEYNKTYKSIIYPGADYFFSQNTPQALQEICAWFQAYKK